MRPQVIVKKMQLPKKLDSAEEPSDDDVNDLDLVAKRSTFFSSSHFDPQMCFLNVHYQVFSLILRNKRYHLNIC